MRTILACQRREGRHRDCHGETCTADSDTHDTVTQRRARRRADDDKIREQIDYTLAAYNQWLETVR